MKHEAEPVQQRPRIICLCGSTRFVDTWINEYQRLSDEGNIVLTVARMPPRPNLQYDEPELKTRLDSLHLRKIDLADEVFVLNVGGYIGNSTRNEINYAESTGKTVNYLEPPSTQTAAPAPVDDGWCECRCHAATGYKYQTCVHCTAAPVVGEPACPHLHQDFPGTPANKCLDCGALLGEQSREDSPAGALWRKWFERIGERATPSVIHATTELVLGERELVIGEPAPKSWIDNLVGLFDDNPEYAKVIENAEESRRWIEEGRCSACGSGADFRAGVAAWGETDLTRMSNQIVTDVRAQLGYRGTDAERTAAADTVKAWLYAVLKRPVPNPSATPAQQEN